MDSAEEKQTVTNWLIGEVVHHFDAAKFPTIGDVLRLYYGSYQGQKRKSASAVFNQIAESVMEIWAAYHQPTLIKRSVVKKIQALVKKYILLRKRKDSLTVAVQKSVDNFAVSMNTTFDILCLEGISEEEDKKLSRRGSKRCQSFDEEEEELSDEDQDYVLDKGDSCFEESLPRSYKKNLKEFPKSNLREAMISPNVTSILDRTNMSSRESVMVLGVVANEMGEDVNTSIVSRATLERHRKKNRVTISKTIKDELSQCDVPLVVHWDGKLLVNTTDPKDLKKKVERHAIVVSGKRGEHILGVPKLDAGTGVQQAESTYEHLEDWELTQAIVGMSFDTTASNTGEYNGACVLLEEKMGRRLLNLACRHHFLELIAKAVFDLYFGPSTGPIVPICDEFQKSWPTIDQTQYSLLQDRMLSEPFGKQLVEEAVVFLKKELDKKQVRDDYRELVELALICLGVEPEPHKEYKFKYPGANHRARWMSKILYTFKIYLFRKQFLLQKRAEQLKMKKMCIFFALIYVQAWMSSSNAADAPSNDLNLYKKISGYASINKAIADVALNKFEKHLWYLSPEVVPLALFSDKVTINEKRAIQRALRATAKNSDTHHIRKIRLLDTTNLKKKSLQQLIEPSSLDTLKLLQFDIEFLIHSNPKHWNSSERYQQMREIVNHIRVVNDSAERAIALATNYNDKLTKDENMKQQVLQVVSDNRKRLPNACKGTIQTYTRR